MDTTYPLSKYQKEQIRSKTGKSLQDITISNIMNGAIGAEDIKISQETLRMQGEVAKEQGRMQLSQNFSRAAELTEVPDELMLRIYDKLRPYRATKQELLDMAKMLQTEYKAEQCAAMVLEAAQIYEKRGILQ